MSEWLTALAFHQASAWGWVSALASGMCTAAWGWVSALAFQSGTRSVLQSELQSP
jgi:hypothetical protein